MEDAKSATEAVIQAAIEAFNSEDVERNVNCFHEKCVVISHEHGVVLKNKTELHDYVASRQLSFFSKLSLQATLDFQMMGEDYAVGCYHLDAYDKQEAVIRRFTDMVVWQKVAGAWLILRFMYAALN